MDSKYRFELVRRQLEGERDELRDYEARLVVAFANVALLHDSIACGALDEAAIEDLPRALHLFRAYARDLLRCYEDFIAPYSRALGRPLPDDLRKSESKQY